MDQLVLIAIGPVQPFIASARKTRDLAVGSGLLQALSRFFAREICTIAAPSALIAPTITAVAELEKLPIANKLLARLSEAQLDKLRAEWEPALASTLETWVADAFAAMKKRLDIEHLRDRGTVADGAEALALKQLRDQITVALVAEPYDGSDYRQARNRLEQRLAAHKMTGARREPINTGMHNRSSLDGQYGAVFEAKKSNRALRAQEHLSGIDIVKRFLPPFDGKKRYASTSDLAAFAYFAALTTDERAAPAWNELLAEFHKSSTNLVERQPNPASDIIHIYDMGVVFPQRLVESLDLNEEQNIARKAQGKLAQWMVAYGDKRKPIPYYVILRADGDNMGLAIEQCETVEAHCDIVKKLQAFGSAVPDIVKNAHGELVYAGGDDVLALLPLHTALACAQELHALFAMHLGDLAAKPSLSVGLAVLHALEPLGDGLRLSASAEHAAKHVDGKNALALIVAKRAGADVLVAGSWAAKNAHLPSLYERLTTLIDYLASDELPDGFAFEIDQVARSLPLPSDDTESEEWQLWRKIHREELIRILARKRTPRGQKVDPDTQKELLAWYDSELRLGELAQELIAARIFAQAAQLALRPVKGGV